MKKLNLWYWITTSLFALLMIMSAIPNIIMDENSVGIVADQLGYPRYIIPFLGVAKVLGAIAILIPGYPRLKEWAYAGLFFDLLGATYSALAVSGFQTPMLFMLVYFGLMGLSYGFNQKRQKVSHEIVTAS